MIATLRRPTLLAETIESICRLDRLPDEIVVVDGDGERSAAPVVAMAASKLGAPAMRYVESEPGLTRQRNHGLSRAAGDVVVFVDDDVEIDSAALTALEEAYADPSVIGATGRLSQPRQHRVDRESMLRMLLPGGGAEGSFTRFGYPRYIRDVELPRTVEFMPGCFMSARRDIAISVGFDERITASGVGEDEDFSSRLARRGTIRYVPDARLHHRLAPSHDDNARFAARTTVANRAYLFRKNFTQTPLARAQFGLLMSLMFVHRLVNAEPAAAWGILEGIASIVRDRAPVTVADGPIPVAFVGSHARRGGSEKYLEQLLEHVDPQWVAATVVLEDGPSVAALMALGRPVQTIPAGTSLFSILHAARKLRRTFEHTHPKVVHANGVKAALVAVLAVARTGVKVVWVKHDFARQDWLGSFVARRSSLLVGVSDAVVEWVSRGSADKVRVVNTGILQREVDRESGRSLLSRELRGERTGPIVGLVARLDPAKGHEELLAVAPGIVAEKPSTRFVLIGGEDPNVPDYEETLRAEIARLGLGDVVTFLGHRADVLELISGLDVLVLPSVAADGSDRAEGFPLVALEALAAGTPVVGYATGGLPEVLGDCGRLVPSGDRDALARELGRLLDDADLRSTLSQCGQKRARESFGLTRMVDALLGCYREAAAH